MKPPWDGGNLVEETIRTHRGVADTIAARNPPPLTMRCICTWSINAT